MRSVFLREPHGHDTAGSLAPRRELTRFVKKPPDVSIIVIAHNVCEEVLACLGSVERHAGGLAVETILIDNGSNDGTVQAVAERFPRVHIVRRQSNEGVPARNHGLRRASGRHRMFLDSDALLCPGTLPTLVQMLDEAPEIGLVAPRLVYPDGTVQLSTRRYPPPHLPLLRRPPLARWFNNSSTVRHHLMADEPHDRRRRVEYVLGACQLFRFEAQSAAGEIDSRIWFGPDDADWCFAIREAGFEVVYVPEVAVVHNYRRTSALAPMSRTALRHLLAFAYFQGKWWGRRRALRAQGVAMDVEARRMAASAPAVPCRGTVSVRV